MMVRCPDSPDEIVGCGHRFEVPDDWRDDIAFDDMIDCPNCGICFNPDYEPASAWTGYEIAMGFDN